MELYRHRKKNILSLPFFFVADPCHHYTNLSEANRNTKHKPSGTVACDKKISAGWYRFVGAAGTRMPTTRVEAFSCGTDWSGWLDGANPTVEDGEVKRKVCFSKRYFGCKYSVTISVKNCGSYFIYELHHLPHCESRYCGTDWVWSKIQEIRELINWSSATRTSGISWSPLFYDNH